MKCVTLQPLDFSYSIKFAKFYCCQYKVGVHANVISMLLTSSFGLKIVPINSMDGFRLIHVDYI